MAQWFDLEPIVKTVVNKHPKYKKTKGEDMEKRMILRAEIEKRDLLGEHGFVVSVGNRLMKSKTLDDMIEDIREIFTVPDIWTEAEFKI